MINSFYRIWKSGVSGKMLLIGWGFMIQGTVVMLALNTVTRRPQPQPKIGNIETIEAGKYQTPQLKPIEIYERNLEETGEGRKLLAQWKMGGETFNQSNLISGLIQGCEDPNSIHAKYTKGIDCSTALPEARVKLNKLLG